MPVPEFDLLRRVKEQRPGVRIFGGVRTSALECPAMIPRAWHVFSRPLPRVRSRRWFAWVAIAVAVLQVGCSLVRGDLPPLRESFPSDGAAEFPISGWITLDFSKRVYDRSMRGIGLSCGGVKQAMRVHRVTSTRLALDPVGDFDFKS